MEPFLQRLGSSRRAYVEGYGLKLVGAYGSMLVNDSEAIAIWAIPTWKQWATYELSQYSEPTAIAWRRDAAALGIDWEGKLLNPVAGSPLVSGVLL
jgi:hypothetical protein